MFVVGLKLRQDPPGPLPEALERAGFALAGGPDVEIHGAEDAPGPPLRACLEGARILVCGGYGPLTAALHVGPLGERVGGHATATRRGMPHLDHVEATPVTGVGYALYRVGPACVALGGVRGRGWAAYLGDPAPDPALAVAVLRWLAAH